jgi:gas vesicle protein
MNQRTEYMTWLCCFLAGGIAGASTALLLAPQSGRDTRGRMGRRLRRAARSARELSARVVDPNAVPAGNGGGQSEAREHAVTST